MFHLKYELLIFIYFITFAIVIWYYINNINSTECSEYTYKALICVLFSIYCAFIAISTICCKSSNNDYNIGSPNREIHKTCQNGLIMISFSIYIIVMIFGIQLFMIDCMKMVGLIIMIEIYMPIITFLFIIAVMMIIILSSSVYSHIFNKKKRSSVVHPHNPDDVINEQPKPIIKISSYVLI
jgi:hypothetical protein